MGKLISESDFPRECPSLTLKDVDASLGRGLEEVEPSERCHFCKWWDPLPEESSDGVDHGWCVRHAPAPAAFVTDSMVDGSIADHEKARWSEVGKVIWPMTSAVSFCGEFVLDPKWKAS